LDTIIDCLGHWAAVHPDKNFSTFLDRHGKPRESYSFQSFDARTRFLAEYLHSETALRRGDRVALVYQPGLEIVAAFVACTRIGLIPVPVPPVASVANGSASRLWSVMQDSGASLALTDSSFGSAAQDNGSASGETELESPLARVRWLATDELRGTARGDVADDPIETLFLQYTSGSTGTPKGVVVSHQNVIHNCRAMTDHQEIGVSWLPQFHDLGLIGYYLFQIVSGGTTYGFSPVDFLRRPALWLQLLSQYQATYTSSPNFGFEYCLSPERVPDDQLEGLDLSSVQVFMNAAEPIRPSTYRGFLERFEKYGLSPAAHVAAYGLAENTLAVSNFGRRSVKVDRKALHGRSVVLAAPDASVDEQLELVSCGQPVEGVRVRIVDPDSSTAVGADGVGEIWLAGRCTTQGYWNKPELSDEVFGNSIADEPGESYSYLRTGDLGFLSGGELFVCGRLKDMVILRGQNYYPEDLEAAVEKSSEKIHVGSVAAFRGADGEERLIVVAGLRTPADRPQPDEVSRSLRRHGYGGPHTIVFVRRTAIKRTTSGKVARSSTREKWLDGDVRAIETHVVDGDLGGFDQGSSSDVQARYRRFLNTFALAGDENARPGEVGLDSLAMAELLLILEQAAIQAGARELQEDLHIPLLQRLTVAKISALVSGFDEDSADWAVSLHAELEELKREREQSEAAAMRKDALLGPSSASAVPAADGAFGQVLLTGATGFLGPYLLQSLLDQTGATYTVLVRAVDPVAARERLRADLKAAGRYDQRTSESFDARVNVVCGDLGSPQLGLDDSDWLRLAETIDTIVHNGARVDYVLDYDALRTANVEGTRELLRLASTSSRKQVHFVSSTTIFGFTDKRFLLERDSNPEMTGLVDFGYAQTKWVAEQLVLQARDQGLDARIYRPAFLTASTAGLGHSTDIVMRLISFMIKYGVAPNADIQLSFMPVDIAAHNIAAVMTGQADPQEPVLHITIDDYFNMVDLTTQISKDYGIPFRYIDLEKFSNEMKRVCTAADPVFPLVDFVARTHSKVIVMEGKQYRNTAFNRALDRSGTGVPNASLAQTVSFLMAHLGNAGMLPEATMTAVSVGS
jgi:thioester reductase-like protein